MLIKNFKKPQEKEVDMSEEPKWELNILFKNAGGCLSSLIPIPHPQEPHHLRFEKEDFDFIFPDIGFLLSKRLPLFPESQLTLFNLGGEVRLVPTRVILKNSAQFLKRGTLFLKEEIEDKLTSIFPVFLDGKTKRASPLLPEINSFYAESEKKKSGRVPLFQVTSMAGLITNPKKFTDKFFEILKYKNPAELLYLSGCGTPTSYPLLVHLGVGVFDSTPLIEKAREGHLFFSTIGAVSSEKSEDEKLCFCQACLGNLAVHYQKHLSKYGISLSMTFKKDLETEFFRALYHNYFSALKRIAHIRWVLQHEDFRSWLETTVHIRGELTAILRFIDKEHAEEMEKSYPSHLPFQLVANTPHSLQRPDIKRYQKKLKNYRKPDWKEILVLLPCSARKPYSFSKSHVLFKKTMEEGVRAYLRYSMKGKGFMALLNKLHPVIITSPMGVVPKELELVYPVRNYDIPVTGDWTPEEREMVLSLLSTYLDENRYCALISHLPYSFVNEFLKKKFENDDKNLFLRKEEFLNPTSREGLEELKSMIFSALKYCEEVALKTKKDSTTLQRDKDAVGRALFIHQFGRWGEMILKNSKIVGNYPYLKVFSKETKKQMAVFNPDKGLFSLSIEAGMKLYRGLKEEKKKNFCVEIDFFPEKKRYGDVFASGVKWAHPDIISGEEVLVIYKDDFVGVGTAILNGEEMTVFKKGKAVKVRHWIQNI